MGDRVTRMRADGHLQCRARVIVLFLLRVENGQVVVRLRQFGKIFRQFGKHGNGVLLPPGFGQDQPFEETPLSIAWFRGNQLLGFFERLRHLPLFHQTLDFDDSGRAGWRGR